MGSTGSVTVSVGGIYIGVVVVVVVGFTTGVVVVPPVPVVVVVAVPSIAASVPREAVVSADPVVPPVSVVVVVPPVPVVVVPVEPESADPEPAVVSPPDEPLEPPPPVPEDDVEVPVDVEDVVVRVPDELFGVTVTAWTLDAVSAGVAFLGGVGGALPATKDIWPFTMLTWVLVESDGLYWYPLPSTKIVDVMLLMKPTIMLEPLMPATALGVWTSNLFPSTNWETFCTNVLPDMTCTWPVESLMMLFVFLASEL